MPTGAQSLNPIGLAKAARRLHKQQAEFNNLLTLLARSRNFSAKFDKATMMADKKAIKSLLKEAGIKESSTKKLKIEELEPDRAFKICYCFKEEDCMCLRILW